MDDQVILHGEHGISYEVLVVVREDLRGNRLIVVMSDLGSFMSAGILVGSIAAAYHQVDVCRAHRMSVQELQQHTSRAIDGQ